MYQQFNSFGTITAGIHLYFPPPPKKKSFSASCQRLWQQMKPELLSGVGHQITGACRTDFCPCYKCSEEVLPHDQFTALSVVKILSLKLRAKKLWCEQV